MSVTASALEKFGTLIKGWQLIPSKGGAFELTVNGELLYSKHETGRHTDPEEINGILQKALDTLRGNKVAG